MNTDRWSDDLVGVCCGRLVLYKNLVRGVTLAEYWARMIRDDVVWVGACGTSAAGVWDGVFFAVEEGGTWTPVAPDDPAARSALDGFAGFFVLARG